MAVVISQLRTELLTDPAGIGYAAPRAAGNHTELARLINLPQPGPTPAAISVFRGVIQTAELLACIVKAEWDVLVAGDRQLMQLAMSAVTVDTSDPGLRTLIAGIFGPATTTRANMIARASRIGSRAEQLFGTNTTVTLQDIGLALT